MKRVSARYRLGAVVLACASIGSVQAMSFGQAFEAALSNDAQIAAARHEKTSTQLGVPIARAGLLPSVSLNMSESKVRGAREFPNSLGQEVRQDLDYSAPQRSLSLRMPLFNYEAISRYRQALAQSDYAEALFNVRGNDLLDRLGSAYLQCLLTEENVRLSEAQVKAFEAQRDRAQRQMQGGELTRIEVAQAEASLDVARVQLIEARDQLAMSRRNMLRITGVDAPVLNTVSMDFLPTPIAPASLSDWVDLAERRNPGILARQHTVESSRLGIHRSQAGHLPRLDLVASASMSRNESLSTLSQESRLHSIGLQLSVPLYSGGGVQASVKQAVSDRERAEADLLVERQNVTIEVQRHFLAVSNGAAKVQAYRKALASMELTLEGNEKALKAGYRTFTDILDAQSKVGQAQRDLAQARYEYLLSRMRLQLQAGAPLEETVADIDRLLVVVPGAR